VLGLPLTCRAERPLAACLVGDGERLGSADAPELGGRGMPGPAMLLAPLLLELSEEARCFCCCCCTEAGTAGEAWGCLGVAGPAPPLEPCFTPLPPADSNCITSLALCTRPSGPLGPISARMVTLPLISEMLISLQAPKMPPPPKVILHVCGGRETCVRGEGWAQTCVCLLLLT
jgi:hypothetical protein